MATIASTADVIRVHGRERGDRLALVQDEHRLTWGDLDRRSSRVANAFGAAGLSAGDRVAFLDKNGYEYFEVLFGGAKCDVVTVNVNWRLAPPEVQWIVQNAEAKVFFFGAEFADTVAAIEDQLDGVTLVCLGADDRFGSYEGWISDDETDPGVEPGPESVAFQLYSSGTTGLPKGVMLSNNNVFSLFDVVETEWDFGEDMVNLAAMPLFHIGGAGWAMAGMYFGATTILLREIDPGRLIDLIGEEQITHAFLVPAVLQFMLIMPNAATADFSSLRMMAYGASPITEEVLRGVIELLGCDFIQVYGLTETTGAICTLPTEDHDLSGPNLHRLRSCGKPNSNVEIAIVDPDSGDAVATGEVGEILTRSEQNMIGYWRNDEGTANAYVTFEGDDDWFRTGDAGYLDADGYLYIHDRIKDMIVSGGENVYPAEVENALMKHEAVGDVAVIGVPDEKWGEVGKAVIVKAEGATASEEDILTFARSELAGFKVPKSVDFVTEIPRNPTGKILKKDLRAPYWEGRERQVN